MGCDPSPATPSHTIRIPIKSGPPPSSTGTHSVSIPVTTPPPTIHSEHDPAAQTSSSGTGSRRTSTSSASSPPEIVGQPKSDHVHSSSFGSNSDIMTPDKGLTNPSGENNCFVNVVLQALLHLRPFASAFQSVTNHTHSATGCVFCALQSIFVDYNFSESGTVPPNLLRSALAELFKKESRFQLGQLDDASEAYEEMMHSLHVALASGEQQNQTFCSPPCLSHKLFGVQILQQVVCSACRATSDPYTYETFILYTPVASLINYSRDEPVLGRMIASTLTEVQHSCPQNSSCAGKGRIQVHLMNTPEIVAIGLVWGSGSPPLPEIQSVVSLVGQNTELSLHDVFSMPNDRPRNVYKLKGMICYYRGKHYVYFGYNTTLATWHVFDDSIVNEVGRNWPYVEAKCTAGYLQPFLLFYQRT
ncbi:ubiquitin specific protease 54 [Pelomyxa schiedti]|nr:ubiquitin specific protease 54 [Pelomyxa schiedti]